VQALRRHFDVVEVVRRKEDDREFRAGKLREDRGRDLGEGGGRAGAVESAAAKGMGSPVRGGRFVRAILSSCGPIRGR
jgi:hypothetical protein